MDRIYFSLQFGDNGPTKTIFQGVNTKLRKLMLVYYEMDGMTPDDVIFVFKDQFVAEDDTPRSLQMKDFDVIKAQKVSDDIEE